MTTVKTLVEIEEAKKSERLTNSSQHAPHVHEHAAPHQPTHAHAAHTHPEGHVAENVLKALHGKAEAEDVKALEQLVGYYISLFCCLSSCQRI